MNLASRVCLMAAMVSLCHGHGRPARAETEPVEGTTAHADQPFIYERLATSYRYEADGQWTLLANLVRRADWEMDDYPTWCRVTSITSHQGRLFCCTGACEGRAADAPADGDAEVTHSPRCPAATDRTVAPDRTD